MADKKKIVSVTLLVSEILFDIRNKAFLTGRSREAETAKTYEASSNMKASEDEEDMSQLLRSITTHSGTLKMELAEYLDMSVSSSSNTMIKEGSRVDFGFSVPSNFNTSVVQTLADGLHAYIVGMSLADWFEITDKADAEGYRNLAMHNLDVVKRALCKRVRPTRPATT